MLQTDLILISSIALSVHDWLASTKINNIALKFI